MLFCLASPRREQSARRALAATRPAAGLRIATAAIGPRITSPAGLVWLPLPNRTGHQVRLIDLDDASHDPWLAYRQEQARKRREVAERDRALYRGSMTVKTPRPPDENHAPFFAGLSRLRSRVPGHVGIRQHFRRPDLPIVRARFRREV